MFKIYLLKKKAYDLILYTMSLAIKEERVIFLKRKYDTSMGTCIFKKFHMLIP